MAGGAAGVLDWGDLEQGAPEITRLGTARLEAAHLAMLGTLRQDGSPRISPVEPHIVNRHLLVAAMTWSAKAADLRRDPRYVLQSTVTGPDAGEGELKVHGIAVEASPGLRSQAVDAWWSDQPPGTARVFVLRIGQVLFVAWDIARAEMTVHRWSPRRGYNRTTRAYP